MNRLALSVAVLSATTFGLCWPGTLSAAPAVQSPAPYLLTKADMPVGWTSQSLSGTGIPGLLSTLCTAEDRLAGACATAAARFGAPSTVPFVVEGLLNWSTPRQALQLWNGMIRVPGFARTMLGHFGTASRTFQDQAHGGVVYLTVLAKGHVVAVLEYADLAGPSARTDAAYWDKTANALIPPKSKAPTTTTTEAPTTTTTTTTTTPPTTVATTATTSTTTSSTGPSTTTTTG